MKILFITTEGFDTPGPNNQMAMVLINDLLNAGFQVHLVQSRRKKINPDIPPLLENREGFTYDIVERKVIDKTRFVNRYFDEASFAFTSYKKWRKVKDADVVFLQSCPTVFYQMLMLRIFNRNPIVYNIYDVFPGHAYDIGVMKSKFIYDVFKFIQKFTYKMSSIVTVLSEDMKNKIIEQNVSANKVRIVPAWYDNKAIREIPLENNKFIKKYNIPADKFYVQFAGTIGYVFNYRAIIEVADILKSKDDIVFQIIGDGNVKQKFVKEAKERNLTNIQFYPLQPIEIVPDVYSACSICIIPLNKGVIGNGVPSKAPLLMACRRVIVNSVESDSEYFRMFNENEIGISVSNDDHEALAEAILKLYCHTERISEMADKAKKFGETNYTSIKSTTEFIKILVDVSKKTKNKE